MKKFFLGILIFVLSPVARWYERKMDRVLSGLDSIQWRSGLDLVNRDVIGHGVVCSVLRLLEDEGFAEVKKFPGGPETGNRSRYKYRRTSAGDQRVADYVTAQTT